MDAAIDVSPLCVRVPLCLIQQGSGRGGLVLCVPLSLLHVTTASGSLAGVVLYRDAAMQPHLWVAYSRLRRCWAFVFASAVLNLL